VLCGLAAVVFVAGCGGSDDDTSAATTSASGVDTEATTGASPGTTGATPEIDPCALLTDDDVDAGFALSDLNSKIVSVTRTPTVITPDTSDCMYAWKAANESSSNFALYVYPAAIYEGLATGGTAETVPEIPGAFETPDGYFVLAGPVTLSLTGVASAAASGALLEAAAARLGG
jgi:hypothetical protein